MKKFILVDPSFDGVTGDKWQYAVAFAKSARANGFHFILLSARQSPELPLIDGLPIDQRPVFSYAFYEHEHIVTRHLNTPSQVEAQRLRLRQQRIRETLDEELRLANEAGDPGRRELIRRRITLAERNAARESLAVERLQVTDFIEPFNHDDFGAALARELAVIEPTHGDVLFFHTMTQAMLESFCETSLHMAGPEPYDVDAYCLFHFGAAAPDARTFLDRYHSYTHSGSLMSRLSAGSPFARLHLLATSEVLAQECHEQLGVPVGVFHGLSNLQDHFDACGGELAAGQMLIDKARLYRDGGVLRVVVRAGDVDQRVAEAIGRGIQHLQRYGITVDLRLLHHAKSLPRVREILEWLGTLPVDLVDVNDNDAYIAELTRANLVLLTYVPERYEKRVSAVLHDCAVMGSSCVVPANTTLASAADYADIWIYHGVESLPATLLQAARTLRHTDPAERQRKMDRARSIYCVDVVSTILTSTPAPSLRVDRRGPIAAFFMPAWGRCGSSYAMEDQIRFLLSRGYFVVQVLVMDKAVDPQRAVPYFWRLLQENSKLMRGCVQRVAYAEAEQLAELELDPAYTHGNAFEQYLRRIGAAKVRDPLVERALGAAELAVVNHVFNSRVAAQYVRCKTVLETHDIQSFQMHGWPLRNIRNGRVEALDVLLQAELAELKRFDHVVNVAPNEHQILGAANSSSSLVTPYVVFDPSDMPSPPPMRIADMVQAWGLSHYYRDVGRFDMLVLGDSHVANRESTEWFIEKVYLPHLQPLGKSLALAGRIAEVMYAKFGTIPCVFYIGFVPNVQVLRSLCDVSLLPDVRGTGISIKTLETFASGQAFVATSRAVRGFAHALPAEFKAHDDAGAFAARTLELLDNAEERARCGQLARSTYDRLTSEQLFNQAWERICHDLELHVSSTPAVQDVFAE